MISYGIDIRWTSVAEESDHQMRLFDGLGPLARDALDNSPRHPDVKTFRARFKADFDAKYNSSRFGNRTLDWTDPEIDAAFAAYIDKIIIERVGHSIEWHKLKPTRLQRPYRSRPIKSSAGARMR